MSKVQMSFWLDGFRSSFSFDSLDEAVKHITNPVVRDENHRNKLLRTTIGETAYWELRQNNKGEVG